MRALRGTVLPGKDRAPQVTWPGACLALPPSQLQEVQSSPDPGTLQPRLPGPREQGFPEPREPAEQAPPPLREAVCYSILAPSTAGSRPSTWERG